MDAGTFQVAQLDGDLDCTLNGNVGTYVTGTKGSVGYGIEVGVQNPQKTTTNYLLDSSFNHEKTGDYSLHAFRLNREGTGYSDKLTASEANWKYRSVETNSAITNYYVAVSWTMTFTYTFNEESQDVGLYLDLSTSSFNPGSQTGTQNKNAAKGFRIAFLGGGLAKNKVWGDLASTTSGDGQASSQVNGNYTYVNSLSTEGNYVADADNTDSAVTDFLSSAAHTSYSKADDNGSNNTKRKDRIGTLAYADKVNGVTTLTITCVAWYEGTDPNVSNGTAMKSVGASMSFYVRSDAPSA